MLKKRLNYIALIGVLGGLGLTSCKDKSPADAPPPKGVASTVAEQVTVAEAATPVVPKASPDARAKALGFAKYLPEDTQGYLAIYDGKGFVESIRGSKLGKFVEERAAEEGMDLNDVTEDQEASMVLSLFAEEFFVSVGKGAGTQADNLMLLNTSSSMHQMKFMVKMFEAELTGKELDPGAGAEAMMMPLIGGLLHDPKGGLAILEKAQMPPVTLGFKVSDADARDGLSGVINDGIQNLLEGGGPDGEDLLEAVNVERAGTKFTGVKIIGEKVAKKLDEEARDDMAEIMDAASVERLIKIIAGKNVVIATGVHDGYVVLFTGSDVEELQIAASPAESLVAKGEMAFVDGYVDKKLLMVSSASKELMLGLTKNSGGLGAMAQGIKEGLAESEGFGDTRDLEVLLDLLVKKEKSLLGMVKYRDGGVLAYREEGLKIESFGLANAPGNELDVPHTFGSLAKRDGVLMFANWVSNEEYAEKSMEYLDTLGEVAYLGAKRMSMMDIDDGDFEQFKEGFGMFDNVLKPDLLKLWQGLRGDLNDGLGGEGAIIVDLKGGLPTVPGIPQVIADKGLAPRIGIVKPVADREKISDSWKNINAAMTGLLKTASEMSGENIPMQRPMSSEKDDLKTWFFATIPFQTDDFVLSVSVDEKNFFASTSKSFVQELSADLAEAKPDPGRKGAYMTVDFNVLRSYVNEWIAMVDENAAEIVPGQPEAAAEIRQNLPMVREMVDVMSELDSLNSYTRNEGGMVRSSIHFKVK